MNLRELILQFLFILYEFSLPVKHPELILTKLQFKLIIYENSGFVLLAPNLRAVECD